MLSNSSKYAINAVIYLTLYASATKRLAPKDVAEALHIPTSFLAKILQTLARKKVISSNKGPGGGFWLTDEEKQAPLMNVLKQIGEADKFLSCGMGFKECSSEKPCPLHSSVQPFRDKFMEEIANNSIASFAQKIVDKTAFLSPTE